MPRAYVEANAGSRKRLADLVSRLAGGDFSHSIGSGWTVGAILAHLAFWDYRVLTLLRRWKASDVGPSPIDTDGVNDAAKPLCLALPAVEAGRLALEAAEAVDSELANLPEELLAKIDLLVQEGKFRVDRSIHRDQHLDEIRRALAGARGQRDA